MDDKTITAVSTSFALMQIQVNALLLLLDQQHPTQPRYGTISSGS
jgi:hypothetical protein